MVRARPCGISGRNESRVYDAVLIEYGKAGVFVHVILQWQQTPSTNELSYENMILGAAVRESSAALRQGILILV
jgi:hypothetical protein